MSVCIVYIYIYTHKALVSQFVSCLTTFSFVHIHIHMLHICIYICMQHIWRGKERVPVCVYIYMPAAIRHWRLEPVPTASLFVSVPGFGHFCCLDVPV